MRRLAAACALLAAPVAAQQAPPPPTGPNVVVTGRGLALPPGTPAYGSVTIERARLTGDASGRVEDVLADVAGVQQFRRADSRSANPSAQGLTLRALGGNASSRALVLLDGVPIADPFFGYVPFNALAPERLAAVRVTRGGGSGPFGAGAVAGTVELVSAGRADLPLLAGRVAGGSFGSVQASAAVTPGLGRGYVTLWARGERSDGFDTTPASQRTAATVPAGYRDWSAGLRAAAPIDADTEVQASGSILDDHRTLRFRGADSSSTGQDASVRLVHRGGGWQVDALAYLQLRNFTNKVVSATTSRVTLDQRDTPSTGVGGKIELRPPVGAEHVLRVGIDTRFADGQLYETAYGSTGLPTTLRTAGGREITTGAFAEDDWTLGRVVLTGGGRVDRYSVTRGFLRETSPAGQVSRDNRYPDRDGTVATGRAGALWHVAPALDLRAAAYTGFRLPTLNELYRPFVVFPVTTQANAALAPERLRGAEVGANWRSAAGLAIELTAFDNRLADAIANVTIGPNLRQRRNVDAILARGLEATASWRHGPLTASASYAFSDARVHAPGQPFDGLVPAQSPRHAASGTLGWTPRPDALLSATLRYVGRQYEDDLQTDALHPATTLDALARVPIRRHVAVELRAENLFDASVETRNQGGSIDLGTPRTLWLGLAIGGG